jgi:hypothetical protein
MATQTSASVQTGTIPKPLEPYYTGTKEKGTAAVGTAAIGTPGTPGYVPASSDYVPASKDYVPASPGLMPTGQKIFSRDYEEVYGDMDELGLAGADRVVGMTADQLAVGAGIRGLDTPDQFAGASEAFAGAKDIYGDLANLTPDQVAARDLEKQEMQAAADIGIGALEQYQMKQAADVGINQFDKAQIDRFMSPYMQSVVEEQKKAALRDAQIANLNQNLGAARRGTYGGSAAILAGTERERNLQDLMARTQATGSQSAYEQAMKAFEGERAAKLQADLANQQAGMTTEEKNLAAKLGVQDLGTKSKLEADRANQAAQQEANRLNMAAEQDRQRLLAENQLKADLANQTAELEAAKQRASVAAGLGSLGDTQMRAGVTEQTAELDRLKALGAYGDVERGVQQQRKDAEYADYLREIGFPEEQIAGMSNLLRGVPLSDKAVVTTAPGPSLASQLGGAGLTGLALYNSMGTK